jgi:hypothetical protein
MYSWDNAQVVLVGNKCDLEDERVISTERGKRLADQLGSRWSYIPNCLDVVLMFLSHGNQSTFKTTYLTY